MIYRITKALPIIILSGVLACNYSADKDYQGAVDSTEAWLVLVDEGKYSDSWKAAALHLRTIVTAEHWEAALIDFRKQLGNVHSRSLRFKKNSTSMYELSGEYVVIQYETKFEDRISAMETITVMLEKDGTWKVSGYDLRL